MSELTIQLCVNDAPIDFAPVVMPLIPIPGHRITVGDRRFTVQNRLPEWVHQPRGKAAGWVVNLEVVEHLPAPPAPARKPLGTSVAAGPY